MCPRFVPLGMLALLLLGRMAGAVIQDTFALADVASDGALGDPANDLRFVSTSAPQSYVVGDISWSGMVRGVDPPDGFFPTWGQELSVRITHDPSGNFGDFQLGSLIFIGNTPLEFTGADFGLFGTVVSPGDTFTLEFFEFVLVPVDPPLFGDNFLGPDAIWDQITFDIDDVSPTGTLSPLASGFVRVEAQGVAGLAKQADFLLTNNASDFWGIEYAAGPDGPSITELQITLSDDGSLYFNPTQILGGIASDPAINVGIDQGVGVRFDDQGVQLDDSFATVVLTFEPGDFGPGDLFRFGVDIDAFGFAKDDLEGFEQATGKLIGAGIPSGALPELSDNLQVTLTFDDGQTVSGTLSELAAGDTAGGIQSLIPFADLAVPPTGGGLSTPEPSAAALVLLALGGLGWFGEAALNRRRRQTARVVGDAEARAVGPRRPDGGQRVGPSALAVAVALLWAGPAHAVIQDSFDFDFVFSDGPQGDINNSLRFTSTSAAAPYTINSIAWDGEAFANEDPTTPGFFPTWGEELSVRITHDQSGDFTELQLGLGDTIGPDPVGFTGLEFSLFGTVVFPGDTFSFEFYESFDDFIGSDAEWGAIGFQFDDITADPPPPLAAGSVRVDANGRNAFATLLSPDETANFWGVTYAAEAQTGGGEQPAPSISSISITLSDDASVYWDPLQNFSPPLVGDATEGIDLTLLTAEFDGEGPQIPDTYETFTLGFAPGDFNPGDTLRFGMDFDAFGFDVDALRQAQDTLETFGNGIPGAELANRSVLGSSPVVTITFDNGEQVTGTMDQLAAGSEAGEFFSYVDLVVPTAADRSADFDGDGEIDGADFLRWQANFGSSGAGPGSGDADGNGLVDDNDYLIWQADFGIAAAAAAATAIPEPTAAGLLACGLLAAGLPVSRRFCGR